MNTLKHVLIPPLHFVSALPSPAAHITLKTNALVKYVGFVPFLRERRNFTKIALNPLPTTKDGLIKRNKSTWLLFGPNKRYFQNQ